MDSFVYLGVSFDNKASTRGMLNRVITKSRGAMYWLVHFLQATRWNLPSMRLLLMDVYVRSVMQFGCVVWFPAVMKLNFFDEHV